MSDPVGYPVGQVAALSGVTVRTLHHYDQIGLLRPRGRSAGGYRRYDDADLARLHRVLSYRELGLPLDQIAGILDDPSADAAAHLRRQHQLVRQRIERLSRMLAQIEKAMEAEQMGISLTPQEQFELFGPDWAGAATRPRPSSAGARPTRGASPGGGPRRTARTTGGRSRARRRRSRPAWPPCWLRGSTPATRAPGTWPRRTGRTSTAGSTT